ncbi:MAG TPA: phosphoglucosamine mutase [Acidimicrobiales bacterium]|nr:phosphoglucosamine mutase [Acidimicrobiales bacterium]
MTLRFGTDGIRGVANVELTPELVLALGRATATVLGGGRVLVARDTRRSGPLLEAALVAGLTAEGCDVERLGVLPTPGVAWMAATEGVAGAMISASHNPFADNGVKLFVPGGRKVDDATQTALEAALDRFLDQGGPTGPTGERRGAEVGAVTDGGEAAAARYLESLVASLEGRDLAGLHVVLDCANGAASSVAPRAVGQLGARVEVIAAEPDGVNINEGCGSNHPEALQAAVVAAGADLGLAFDGDADRVVAVDHTGALVDGDHLIAMCAVDLAARDRLAGRTVVVTVMTNLGFRLAMARAGIEVVETAVGDRHVLEALEEGGWSLGGEQSGHVIFRDLATTGDGTLTGLQILDLVRRSGRTLADLAAGAMTRLPQVLVNVAVARRRPDVAEAVAGEIAAVEAALGEPGRVLIRPSGTEPVVRVMVEAPTAAAAEDGARRLATAVEAACEH